MHPSTLSKPQVNLGNFFGRSRAVEDAPKFSQYEIAQYPDIEEGETIHVALVRITDIASLSDNTVDGIAQTLSQLARLSMAPCVVLEDTTDADQQTARHNFDKQADRLVRAIDVVDGIRARRLDSILSVSEGQQPEVFLRKLLMRPLRQNHIPVIAPIAYSTVDQRAVRVSANEVILALTTEFAGLNIRIRPDQTPEQNAERVKHLQNATSVDRIIIVDAIGGIPGIGSADEKQVFINLEQEYASLQKDLSGNADNSTSRKHIANLTLLRDALQLLPPASSGLVTTPTDASNPSGVGQSPEQTSSVGTRRRKNPLIHNLLTDKPAYSSSLPQGRLQRKWTGPPMMSSSTFVKRGMPLTILPDPAIEPWRPDAQPRLKLTDPRIDLPRLVHLINDSFGRELDVEHYLNRVNSKIAGVIIAGEYEGGALLTWETPPGASDTDTSRLVPYLDKFAVLKRSQGAGGVADIVFNAMVRTCFPEGVCWRSRKNNPVNKWYFERSRGTWKIPDMNWTMFWTTEMVVGGSRTKGVPDQERIFADYEGVCRGVEPSWADSQKPAD